MLLDDANRLRIQPVQIRYSQGQISVAESGVTAGQRLVVSDLVPAVEGMLLLPEPDEQLQLQLLNAAGDAP